MDMFTIMKPELDVLTEQIAQALLTRGARVATAESCTGGWVAKVFTDLAGSSQWFDRGFITYSNQAKQEMLGVPGKTLEQHGAVSGATVAAMVSGVLERSQADYALAISGIAGPGGGTAEKPVGTVWFAWQQKGETPVSCCHRFDGDREAVRLQAVRTALQGLGKLLGQE